MAVKIYLAASFSRQAEMRDVAIRLVGLDVEITSRWLFEEQGMKHGNARRKHMMKCAFTDLEDVRAADVLVRFTDDLTPTMVPSHLATGARMGEMMYAYAIGKPVIVVGGYQNVFDYLPNIVHLNDTNALIQYLNPEEIH
jgi:nucleoside 2-deoxyribosyltransferase